MTAAVMDRVVRTCTACGWTSKRSTPGLADHALRQHSCEKHRRSVERHARGLARDAAVDRTPKSCLHKRARHEHGHYATYTLDGCRCLPCAGAASQYESDRLRRVAYGRTRHVPAEPVREHLAALAAAGVGLKRVAVVSGVSTGTLTKIVYGVSRGDGTRRPPSSRVLKTTADKLLAVTAHDAAPAALVDGVGAARRLQALVALGWSVQRLALEHGLDRQGLDRAVKGGRIHGSTAAAVRAMYDAIGDARPPERTKAEKIAAARSRRRAAEAGWAVPALWDAEALDDPTALPPAPVPAESRAAAAVTLDEWVHLVRGGEHIERAAQRCGRTLDSVRTAAERTHHHDALRALGEALVAAAVSDQQEAAGRRLLRLADAHLEAVAA